MVFVWHIGVSGKGLWSEAPDCGDQGLHPLCKWNHEIQHRAAHREGPPKPARSKFRGGMIISGRWGSGRLPGGSEI